MKQSCIWSFLDMSTNVQYSRKVLPVHTNSHSWLWEWQKSLIRCVFQSSYMLICISKSMLSYYDAFLLFFLFNMRSYYISFALCMQIIVSSMSFVLEMKEVNTASLLQKGDIGPNQFEMKINNRLQAWTTLSSFSLLQKCPSQFLKNKNIICAKKLFSFFQFLTLHMCVKYVFACVWIHAFVEVCAHVCLEA